jgi:hypothetical protein
MSDHPELEKSQNRRPLSVTIISCLFIAAGLVGFAYHATEFRVQGPFQYEAAWVLFVRLLALVGGVFALRGANWARWLLMVWMAYHVGVSAFHTVSELVMHSVLFVVIAYVLLREQASAYFRSA